MKKETRKKFYLAACVLAAFALWTAAVCLVDVQAIGPQGSSVGFAEINGFVFRLTGVHMALYALTDWLSVVPLGFAAGFGVLGLVQWIRRKKISKVDYSLLVLGGFYIAVFAAYVAFEVLAVNNRPVLMGGCLEASYPSSTTMLVMCVMPTAGMQLRARMKNAVLKRCCVSAAALFTFFMVIARLVSGVHWFTDIIGSALLSAGLVLLYAAFIGLKE